MDPDPLLCSLNYLCGILVQAHQAPITINLPTLGSIFAILVALCGLLLSAFNSGSEIAYFSLTADDVEHIEDERQRSRVAWLLSNPERLLSTILIGNNLVNVMIVIVLNFAMNQIFQFNNAVVDFLVQTVILTFLILLFGEVIPKLYATNNNRTFAVMVSGPLCVAVRLFSPLSRILVKGTGIVSKVVSEKADDISMDDLSHALERSDMKSEEEKELLEGILTFGEKTVSEIMRPRIDVVDVDYNDKFTDVVNKVIEAGYSRMPVYDERIVLKSWPGKTMHLLFPRYYSMETTEGEPLLRASAIWGLVDESSRKMIFPEKHGIVIEGVVTGGEIALPSAPARLECTEERRFVVPYSYVDINGHMNNTRYFDLAEDSIPAAAAGRALRSVGIEYANEARCGEELTVRWGQAGDDWYLTGEADKCVFRLRLGYAPEE